MLKRKRFREKGKVKLSEYFKELKEGDKVALVRNLSFKSNFPRRMQGKTGNVIGKRGKAFIVKIKNGNKLKTFIVNPINLKKLK